MVTAPFRPRHRAVRRGGGHRHAAAAHPEHAVGGAGAAGVARLGLALAAGGGAAAFGLDVLVALLIFVLAAMAFRYGLLGGGDVKLLAAGGLWLGAAALGPYLLTTVLAGGALARRVRRLAGGGAGSAAGTKGPSLPYGVAIAAGGILTTAGALWS